ncbi:dynamin family protein [Helicobacter turcicus]|uniref:Dynamin family protein n=1 Tax=Helicobacter turcicus TaxID=2867412 RepID=A0ABS7JN80_9HELI|nr:dynamin family protein [Helicobacter turcicus]MBX7490819.1 dynamin family protein [Helicobacter turcicus]MBX7545572.1 dynamin family protein [Helicobacter turcicus]
MEQKLAVLQEQLQENFQEYFREYFKEVIPLGNLHILEQNNASEILAIFLSLDTQGFNTFWQSETLQQLCEKYCKTLSFKGIMQVQYTLLLNLQKAFFANPKATQELLKDTLINLETLKRENLTKSVLLDSIKTYFNRLIETKIAEICNPPKETSPRDSTFTAQKVLLEDFLEESLKILHSQQTTLKERITKDFAHLLPILLPLESLLQKAKNQHFSLGVTGVLSSGKSTLLNALLGKEILGSSTIPETASLTLLKYAKTPSACVSFWNTQEWEDLKSTMNETTLNALFNNPEFKETFKTFVQDSTQSLNINIDELPKYTSANHPSKICNLIKETTLFTPLKFLENNVEIVDTPGLDDPIIQREEITKSYLAKCDLLIHAMNASQSATQVDRDFILQTLQNANLSRILILLTHADLLEKNELEAALNYTKESIKESIKTSLQNSQNTQNNTLELLFARLDFIALASYPALICQSNPKKAQELGYSLEDSNFNALITYLNQTLLGKNSTKAKDIIYLCAQGFKRIHQSILDSITLEQSLLFAKADEVEAQITKAKQEKERSQDALDSAKNALDSAKMQLKDFSTTLQNQLNQKLQNAQSILSERVFADIIYEYEKGRIPTNERLEYLLDLGLKDLLSEILRFSAQSLDKKISQLSLQFQTHLENIALSSNAETLQNKNFNLHLNPILLQKTKLKILNKVIKSAKSFNKNKQDALKNTLEADFKEGFLEFINALVCESNAVESQYITHFSNLLDSAQTQLELDLQSKENILQNALNNLHINATQKQQREQILRETSEFLNAQIKECQTLQYYVTRGENA